MKIDITNNNTAGEREGLPVTVQVRPGQAAVLHCPLLTASGGAVPSFLSSTSSTRSPSPTHSHSPSFTLSWYRQVWEGQSPELLLSLKTSPDGSHVQLGPSFGSDQVTALADGSLQLSAPQRSDTAVYYCSLSRGVEEGSWSGAGH